MTTIAYKDGVIAYDSRCTQGGTICDDNHDKHHKVGGTHYFVAGVTSDVPLLIQLHQGKIESAPAGSEASAIIVRGTEVSTAGIDKDGRLWCCSERPGITVAIGSGEQHALTAMDMGADAKTAVKMAAKRDIYTGGRIRTFKVKL